MSGIAGCLISHEHKDHAGCYEQLIRSGVPVYASRGTAEALVCEHVEPLEDREVVTLGSFDILPFPTFHDAAEPMGFLIRSRTDGDKLVFATDTVNLGYQFPGVDLVAIECNYDEAALEDAEEGATSGGKRPHERVQGLRLAGGPGQVPGAGGVPDASVRRLRQRVDVPPSGAAGGRGSGAGYGVPA